MLDEQPLKRSTFFLYALACGALLVPFSLIKGLISFVFSVPAFLLGLRVFSLEESWKKRFLFIGLSLLIYIVLLIVYIAVAIVQGWPLPETNIE